MNHFGKNLWLAHLLGFNNSMLALSKTLGQSRGTVVSWIRGEQQPSLLSVLGAAYVLGIGMVELFCKPVEKLFANGMRHCPETVRQNHSAHANRYSRPAMEAVLDRVLRDNSLEPPPSLRAVARQVGCHMTRLVSIFPEKTHAIKTAHQNWIQSRKVEHQANIQRAIREAVLKVHATGAYPSSGRVKALLPTYADLRSAFARSVWNRLERIGTRGRIEADETCRFQ